MSIEKQKLYNEIETLPEEFTNQVINFIEYLKLSYIDTESADSVTIKRKKFNNATFNVIKTSINIIKILKKNNNIYIIKIYKKYK